MRGGQNDAVLNKDLIFGSVIGSSFVAKIPKPSYHAHSKVLNDTL
jgi:hypothetical protein